MSPVIILLSIVTLAALSLAFVYYSRSANLYALVADASSQSEAAKKSQQRAEYELKQIRDKLEETREQMHKSERSLDDARCRLQNVAQEKNDLKKSFEAKGEQERRQLEHLSEQVKVLSEQLAEAVAEKQRVTRERDELVSGADSKAKAQLKPLQDEVRSLRQHNQDQEKELKKAKSDVEKAVAVLKTVDPIQMKKYKQRLASMEQLIVSMRGLRELAEERSQNYELALRKLSCYIVKAPETESAGAPLGPLVGEALEKIGATFFEDDVNAPLEDVMPTVAAAAPTPNATH